MPLTSIRNISRRITYAAERQYQRALATIGIADCTEMRVTGAVAVCVVLYYIICGGYWIAQSITGATTLTALITDN